MIGQEAADGTVWCITNSRVTELVGRPGAEDIQQTRLDCWGGPALTSRLYFSSPLCKLTERFIYDLIPPSNCPSHPRPKGRTFNARTSMSSLACGRAASTASVYVQIAKRCITASTASRPPLDILAPRYYRKGTGCHLSYYTTSSTSHRNAVQGRRNSLSLRHRKSILLEQRRPFTTTRRRSTTACVYNPQTDENGDEMVLEITDRAGKVWDLKPPGQ